MGLDLNNWVTEEDAFLLAIQDDPDDTAGLTIAFHVTIVDAAASPRIKVVLRAMSGLIPGNFFALVPGAIDVERKGLTEIARAVADSDAINAGNGYQRMMRRQGELGSGPHWLATGSNWKLPTSNVPTTRVVVHTVGGGATFHWCRPTNASSGSMRSRASESVAVYTHPSPASVLPSMAPWTVGEDATERTEQQRRQRLCDEHRAGRQRRASHVVNREGQRDKQQPVAKH